ncbi:glycosyltransferase family 39 protein [Streptomyces sp. 1222.5]|uniref:glycosyltransferase family 39 protein n=1 Tax=Streptomyces sp. 1222.5 TaxID=1881026 RepID=UPI003D765359
MTDLSVEARLVKQARSECSGGKPSDGSDVQYKRLAQAPNGRSTWCCRGILLCILIAQGVLSLRLSNTAFEDEALYLYAGHLNLDHLLSNAPYHEEFTKYFSGSPLLYPVFAALIDSVCGLAGARAFSLAVMLGATALLYLQSRRLFDMRAALYASAIFSVSQSTLTLGNLATYDATVIFLLALATWIVVRSADSRRPLFCLCAAPVLALAVAVKYAALMYLPVVLLIAGLIVFQHRGRRLSILHGLLLPAATGSILFFALQAASASYVQGLKRTTTEREQGSASLIDLLSYSAVWGGLTVALALIGVILYTREGLREECMSRPIFKNSALLCRLVLSLTLTSAAILAPLYQMYLHTETSLHKHIGYGLLFAAPVAGVAVSRLTGARFRYPFFGISVLVCLLVMGVSQAQARFDSWPDSSGLVKFLKPSIKKNGHYLLENRWPITYYFRKDAEPQQWISTNYFIYADHGGVSHRDDDAYEAAIRDRYFDIVVLTYTTTKVRSEKITKLLKTSNSYRTIDHNSRHGALLEKTYQIWVRR